MSPGTNEEAEDRCATYERLAALFDGAIDESVADRADAQSDYVRLFVTARNGVPAPLYASWYLDRTLCGPSLQWVESEYHAEGLAPALDAAEPADYLSCELEYLYFLARHERAALATDDVDALLACRTAQLRFLDGHLRRWLPDFVRCARSAGPGPVYAKGLEQLERFVSEERARLVSLCGDAGSRDTPPG